MADVFEAISDELAEWLAAQPMFFVATAPSSDDGHVNLSPKGLDSFAVIDATHVCYLDLTGSGVETIAHLRDDGRITVMFCAFAGKARIVRLYGHGVVHELGSPRFAELASRFSDLPGCRSIIDVAIERVSTSCGYGVPLMDFRSERGELENWADARGADGLVEYRARKNASSIDGLRGFGARA